MFSSFLFFKAKHYVLVSISIPLQRLAFALIKLLWKHIVSVLDAHSKYIVIHVWKVQKSVGVSTFAAGWQLPTY